MKIIFLLPALTLALTLAEKNLTDREILKQELFVQRLANKMNHQLR